MTKIRRTAKLKIPFGLLSFMLSHELAFTGADVLAAPLIFSVVIIQNRK